MLPPTRRWHRNESLTLLLLPFFPTRKTHLARTIIGVRPARGRLRIERVEHHELLPLVAATTVSRRACCSACSCCSEDTTRAEPVGTDSLLLLQLVSDDLICLTDNTAAVEGATARR